jgi:hypothetical protein
MRILLRDLTPGTNYNLQLRQNDGSTVSDWSRIFQLLTTTDTTAPAQVTGVTWVVNGPAFNAKWTATTLDEDGFPCLDLSHYVVRIASPSSGTFDVKTTNNFYDLSFEANNALFGSPQPDLTVTIFAVDIAGNTSVASSSVNAVNPAPPDPTNFAAAGIVGAVSLLWDVQVIDDLAAYDVYMSTSGSGFIPGPSNLVWSGTGNSYIHESDSLGVIHYFKLRARDMFGSTSNYVSASATPVSPVAIDTTPPAIPTGLNATMTVDTNDSAFAIATVTWSAVADTDLAGYVVRYKPSAGTSYNYVNVPVGNTTVTIEALVVGVQYDFAIQSFDQLANRSAWSTAVNATAANTAPSTPTTATAVASTQSIQVSHNLQKATSGRLEADVSYLQVHLGTTSGFTADDSNLIGSMQVEPGSTFVSAVFTTPVVDSSVDRWVRVIAVDRGGLKSTQSAVSAVTVGLILNANIANATITSAKINDLEANKITAGTGIINDLLIKSSLTVDTAGIVKSSNYSAGTAGWQLTNNTLEINQGTIKAAALQLQDSANIVPPQYADFEFLSSYYTGKLFTFNSGGTTTASIATSPEITPKYGLQVLKHVWDGGGGGTYSRVYQSINSTDYNIQVEPNTDYIISAYFRVLAGGGAKSAVLSVKTGDATITPVVTASILDNGTWQRMYGTFNTGSQTQLLTFTSLLAAGTIYMDGLQFERKLTGLATPSPWRSPSVTTIDGGSIRTGSIQSTASANGLGGQPAWSINTTGGAQFGDAAVRGRLVVGDISNPSGDGVNSRIHSANYSAGVSGWIIRNDGSAEFADVTMRSSDGSGNTITVANGVILGTDSGGDEILRLNNEGLTLYNHAGFGGGGSIEFVVAPGFGVTFDAPGQITFDAHGLGEWSQIGMRTAEHNNLDGMLWMNMIAYEPSQNIDPEFSVYSTQTRDAVFSLNGVDQGRGIVGYIVSTSSTATGSAEIVHVTSPNIDFHPGRAYRATYHFQGTGDTANNQIGFRIRRQSTAGTSLYDSLRTKNIPGANAIVNGEASQIFYNSTASTITTTIIGTTYRAFGASGNVGGFANTANPVWLMVEDIGLASDYPGIKAM